MSIMKFIEFVQFYPQIMQSVQQPIHNAQQPMPQFMQADNNNEEQRDIKKTLDKLPKAHSALVQGYNWKIHPGNTLNGDDQHVGYVDDGSKEIAVAGPWNYGREFTILHEVAHKVWDKYIKPYPEKIQEWSKIVKNTKNRQNQEPEELWCMAYANHFAKNKIVIHTHKEWENYMAKFMQQFKQTVNKA